MTSRITVYCSFSTNPVITDFFQFGGSQKFLINHARLAESIIFYGEHILSFRKQTEFQDEKRKEKKRKSPNLKRQKSRKWFLFCLERKEKSFESLWSSFNRVGLLICANRTGLTLQMKKKIEKKVFVLSRMKSKLIHFNFSSFSVHFALICSVCSTSRIFISHFAYY